jgi:hypothetical protein
MIDSPVYHGNDQKIKLWSRLRMRNILTSFGIISCMDRLEYGLRPEVGF